MAGTALITGASAGLGRALAVELHGRGFDLALCARRLGRLEALRGELGRSGGGGGRVEIAELDVADHRRVGEVFRALHDRLGGLDVVVVNAGINRVTRTGVGCFAQDAEIIGTNLLGAMASVDAAVALFREAGKGHVVGISSLAGLMSMRGQASYCASKAGFNSYLDSARIELRHKGIRVTKIMPGFIKTEIVDDMDKYPFCISAEQAAQEVARHIERGSEEGIVPAYPWRILAPVLTRLPERLVTRIMG